VVDWSGISLEHLIYLYQNQSLIEKELLQCTKKELIERNILNSNFEALLSEKVREISELKGELEKYKMGEKLATSILDSPYRYNNNA